MKLLHQNEIVFSIRAVRNELLRGNDRLSEWVKELPETFFHDERKLETQRYYSLLMNWAHNNPKYTDKAKTEFASSRNADPWLIAYAAANNMKLVTHEVFDPNIKKEIKHS